MSEQYGPDTLGSVDPLDSRIRRFVRLQEAKETNTPEGFGMRDAEGRVCNESKRLDGDDLEAYGLVMEAIPEERVRLKGMAATIQKWNLCGLLMNIKNELYLRHNAAIGPWIRGMCERRGLANFEGAEYDKGRR